MQTRLHFECDGAGADLLLIHGFASSMRMWTPLVEALRDSYRLWRVDLTGFGATPLPADESVEIDIDYHLQTLTDFCDAQSIRPYALFGHSMGGLLTLRLAQQRPDLAARLVLFSPVVTGQAGMHFALFHRVFGSPLRDLLVKNGEPLLWLSRSDLPRRMLASYRHSPPHTLERINRDWERTTWRAAVGALASMGDATAEPFLPQIAQPTLVIVGARDFTVPPSEGRLAAATLPHAELIEYAGGFHQPLDEQPDRTLAAVQTFLASASGS